MPLLQEIKKKYYLTKIQKGISSGNVWRALSSLGFFETQSADTISPDELNKHFTSVLQLPCHIPMPSIESHLSYEEFNFIGVSQYDAYMAFKQIKSNAVGVDKIGLKFFMLIMHIVIPHITHILNHCIASSYFPYQWKIAKVIPIPKTATPATLSDYRPISILPVFSKAFEILLYNQMIEHIENSGALSAYQSGFRKLHSTTTALAKIQNDISAQLNLSKSSILVLLDFSKAFDTVNHICLVQKLKLLYGFSDYSVRLISSFLNDRRQVVQIGDTLSPELAVRSGVPQGSVLAPLLFALFINDLPNHLKWSSYHLYADDFQLYVSAPLTDIVVAAQKMNDDLELVNSWAKRNGLLLNASKTQAMLISNAKHLNPPHLHLNGELITYKDRVKNLGLVMSDKLTWNYQVAAVCGKVQFALRKLKYLQRYTPFNIRLMLVKSVIMPVFTYCDIIYHNMDYDSRSSLQVAFNSCIRYVYALGLRDHVSPYQSNILGVTLFSYFKLRVVTFFYKLIKSQHPSYLYSLLTFASSARTKNLIIPRNRVRAYSSSLFVSDLRLWNALPMNTKLARSLPQFKALALQHFKAQ